MDQGKLELGASVDQGKRETGKQLQDAKTSFGVLTLTEVGSAVGKIQKVAVKAVNDAANEHAQNNR